MCMLYEYFVHECICVVSVCVYDFADMIKRHRINIIIS